MSGPPSPGAVSALAWSCVGLYLLAAIAWEWRKTVRRARRERARTEQVQQREQQLTEEARKAATDG